MKHLHIFLLFIGLYASAQLKIPNLSPLAHIEQTVGLTNISIDYSRPSSKGRVIFGEGGVLPFNQVWRTGANAATKISFSTPVTIQNNLLQKGSYTILSIPNREHWKINWYPYKSTNWNSYVHQKPLLSMYIPVQQNTKHRNTLALHFQDLTFNSTTLLIEWEKLQLQIPILVDQKKEILKNISNSLAGPTTFDYFQAALYLHETKTNLQQALRYIQKATSSKGALFFQVTREALILKDLHQKTKALQVAKRALILSEKAKNLDFIRINKNLINELSF